MVVVVITATTIETVMFHTAVDSDNIGLAVAVVVHSNLSDNAATKSQ